MTTDKDTTPALADLDLDKLEELARAATPQNFDSAQVLNQGHIECPSCDGSGEVELTADYCNYDGRALGVQFYGIGPEHRAAEAFYRAANPAAVLQLVALARRAAQPVAPSPQVAEGAELPPLPEPYTKVIDHDNAGGESTVDAWMELYEGLFTAEQYRQGQRDAIAASRRAAAPVPASTSQKFDLTDYSKPLIYSNSADKPPVPASTGLESFAMQLGRESLPFDTPTRELDVEAERREFEAWVTDCQNPFIEGEEWSSLEIKKAWLVWQARAARSAAQSTAPAPDDRLKLDAARKWIASAPHGENCFLHDEGEYDRCFCGKDALEAYLDSDSETAPVSTEQAGDAWQPIESAPKTGRTLLLGRFNDLGNWRTMRGQWFSQAAIDQEWEEPDEGEEGWYETAVEPDVPNCWPIAPTHWMPLPSAPSPNNSPVGGKDKA